MPRHYMHSTTRRRVGPALAAVLALAVAIGCGGDEDGPLPPRRSTKNVTIIGGAGSGRVASSDGKIDCRIANGATTGPTCTAAFDSGSVATLTAAADAGQEFIAWSGDCTGSSCQLSVTRDVTASARFVALESPLVMELVTPNNDDGAILLTIAGPSILGVTPGAGLELVESRSTSGGTTTSTVLIRGKVASGVVGQLSVRGVNLDSPYTVQIREVAARASGGYAQRTDLGGYRLTVRR